MWSIQGVAGISAEHTATPARYSPTNAVAAWKGPDSWTTAGQRKPLTHLYN